VAHLFQEKGKELELIPYDEALPLVDGATIGRPDLPRSHVRVGLTIRLPGDGGWLELCFAKLPTYAQYLALSDLASDVFSNIELPVED
jgi:hypothetical protein